MTIEHFIASLFRFLENMKSEKIRFLLPGPKSDQESTKPAISVRVILIFVFEFIFS